MEKTHQQAFLNAAGESVDRNNAAPLKSFMVERLGSDALNRQEVIAIAKLYIVSTAMFARAEKEKILKTYVPDYELLGEMVGNIVTMGDSNTNL